MTAINAELVGAYLDDFQALHDALIARMNGTASRETLAALAHRDLAGPIVSALAYADVTARGRVRCGELRKLPAVSMRLRRRDGQRLRVARARAEADYRGCCLASVERPASAWIPLELRVLRAAATDTYAALLEAELAHRGHGPDALTIRGDAAAEWARQRGLLPAELPDPVRGLLDCSVEDFLRVLSSDAEEAENEYLPHDAVVERWHRHAPTALAWGRYAVAYAERAILTAPLRSRESQFHRLEDAYQDLAVLTARAREAKHLAGTLRRRVRRLAAEAGQARLVRECHEGALRQLVEARPDLHGLAVASAALHQPKCPDRERGCPHCHSILSELLTSCAHPENGVEVRAPHDVSRDNERYAILDDLPPGAIVAVADAALGDESALCGYAWAAEDGSAAWGHSFASGSGEAESIGICAAALALLDRHPSGCVVVLCDSREAVSAIGNALATGESDTIHKTMVFPEGHELAAQLLAYRSRVQVRWLKGHIGHDLNEKADALARVALSQANGRLAPAAAQRQAARVCA